VGKIRNQEARIRQTEERDVAEAEVIVLSYGITSRVAERALDLARAEGIRVGSLRLKVVWPFPEERVRELAGRIKSFVVPELNLGQIVFDVERCAAGQCKTRLVPHAGGIVHDPQVIYEAIREAAG